ncbi:signal peptidase I [Lacipirellula parvula]|uniref:Signal peptidase I n=1 Tax=Lacipirellula parvula TaxID=2650471 RepID=A0A5K7XGH2_9BACT|nr:signal peptidase I [Lacipirellula parvula]BBO35950.1 signal peptidase I [Lacipirellula parvula]
MDDAEAEAPGPRRRVWLAALLALLFGAVAQVYCGRFQRALAIYALTWLVLLLANAALLCLPFGRLAITAGFASVAGVYLFVLIDAIRLARSDSRAPLCKYQRWWVYLLLIIASGTISELVLRLNREYWSEAFVMRVGSMRNSLLAGDRFIVDKLPLYSRPPQRGEIVVYRSSGEGRPVLCHRVVGLPGDEVEIRDEQLLLNGEPAKEEYALYDGERRDYDILNNFAAQTVPAGHVFILGDNRRNAKDSRVDGFVPIDDVLGVPKLIFWSREHSLSPPSNPRESREPVETWGPMRWDRIGQRLD